MSRYIDADALIKHIKDMPWKITSAAEIMKFLFLTTVEEAPTADVVEVVHAEWVGTEYDGYADGYPVYDKWECSKCHEEYNSDGEPPMFNYCPNCGAKMDGERSENDNS